MDLSREVEAGMFAYVKMAVAELAEVIHLRFGRPEGSVALLSNNIEHWQYCEVCDAEHILLSIVS
jgi:hypothetical protein